MKPGWLGSTLSPLSSQWPWASCLTSLGFLIYKVGEMTAPASACGRILSKKTHRKRTAVTGWPVHAALNECWQELLLFQGRDWALHTFVTRA